MDSSFHRRIGMMQREGFDPAVLREVIRRHRERRARFGLVAVLGFMLCLAAISLATPQEDAGLGNGSDPRGGAVADAGGAVPGEAVDDESLLWLGDGAPPATAAASPGSLPTRPAFDGDTH